MYIDTTTFLNSQVTESTTEASSELGKDDFLKILIAQLETQDPFNPLDDKEMVSQLAQFSSLEQLTNMSESLETASDLIAQQTAISAVSYVGMDVYAEDSALTKDGDDISGVIYSMPEDATQATAYIYDESGVLLDSVDLGSLTEGEHQFQWDGLDSSGDEAADGLYNVAIYAENANGESLSVSTYVSGKVTGVSTESGSVMLILEGDREVNLLSIYQVGEHQTQ